MMHRPARRHLQASPEALGDARRRFYEIYALVSSALPEVTSHQDVCDALSELAMSTYTDAARDRETMSQLWEGHGDAARSRRSQ